MPPIRLAVFFNQPIFSGGGYQQSINAALLTCKLPPDLVQPIFYTTLKENVAGLHAHGIDAIYIKLLRFPRVRSRIRNFVEQLKIFGNTDSFLSLDPFERQLLSQNIDLVYFLSPEFFARYLVRLNYITTVWDLCHRDDPEFPEVRWGGEFEARENNYRAILPRATAILVDSEQGKDNVVRRYGIDTERIYVMPFEAAQGSQLNDDDYSSAFINIQLKYKLDVPYVFYPAQFWAHKNHVYLLEGLKILECRYGKKIGAIFAGCDQGNLDYVKEYVNKLSLQDRVRFAGFVPNSEIPYLYRQSLALVMPTYFGPTNIPPLEAFSLGVPVLYPDKAGLRDQVAGAALLMDLNNPSTMADHLARLISDADLRECLISAGQVRLESYSHVNRVQVLESIIKNFQWRRTCWR
jgi:glycosyltransferase involved in cell wall biosynthesis